MTFVDRKVAETAGMNPERKSFVVPNLHVVVHSLHIVEDKSESEK